MTLERIRFRRDGDPFGGKGEVGGTWDIVPVLTEPTFRQSGSFGNYKLEHSKKPKKCDDDGCTSYSDSDCHWYHPNVVTFTDWSVGDNFCNPLRVNFNFKEHDKNSERTIGDFATGGSQSAHLNSPAPSGANTSLCEDFALVNTPKSTPARLAMRWNIDEKLFGSLAGTSFCNSDTASCGAIESYAYQHISGPEMRSLMLMENVDLGLQSFAGTRRIDIAYDVDANPSTGDPASPLCGAGRAASRTRAPGARSLCGAESS